MTDIQGDLVSAVALKVLEDRVSRQRGRVNDDLKTKMDVEDRKAARLASGVKVGTVTYSQGKTTASVMDETVLTEWVRENHPDEIVPIVRGSFRAFLLDQVKEHGGIVTPDGELIEVPGVQVRQGSPYLSVRPDPAALPDLVEVIRANQILALEAGE